MHNTVRLHSIHKKPDKPTNTLHIPIQKLNVYGVIELLVGSDVSGKRWVAVSESKKKIMVSPTLSKLKASSKSKESKVSFKVYSGRLDKSIVPLLEYLNAMGIKTTMSCSGLNRDHDGKINIANGKGLMFIDFIEPSSKRLVNKVKRAAVKAGLNYHSAPSFWPLVETRVDYTSFNDTEREQVWRKFFEELQH